MFESKKILTAAAALMIFTASAQGICQITKRDTHTAVYSGKDLVVATTAKGNYVISSIQVNHKPYMYFAGLTCYEEGVKTPCNEANTPAGKCTELKAENKDGKIVWQIKYQWRNMDVIRTIETGDHPGFKLTYDVTVTKDFPLSRIYMSLRFPPNNLYNRTGYVKNGIIQFRPIRKAEWFGILRSKTFPYITFSGDTVKEGAMIAAGDMTSWNKLPATLLYSTSDKAYWTVELVYQLDKTMKKGDKHTFSVYIMPVSTGNVAGEAQANFLKIKDSIK